MKRLFATDDINLQGHHIVDWRWLEDLPVTGASDGQVIAYIDGKVQWATVSGTGTVAVTWGDIADKPAVFAPDTHTHTLAEITDYVAPDVGVTTVTAGTGINLSTSTGAVTVTCDLTWSELADKPVEFPPADHTHSITDLTDYNAITALNAGTNIEVNGATISVVATPTFSDINVDSISASGNLIIDGNIDIGGDIGFSVGGAITGATTITGDKLVSTADISAVDDVTANNAAYFMGGDRRGYGVQADAFGGAWARGLYFYNGGTILGAHYGYGTAAGVLTRMGIAPEFNSATGLHVDVINNRVGIGVATPSRTLDVNGTALVQGNVQIDGFVAVNYSGPDSDGVIYFYEDGSTSGAEIRFDDSADEFAIDHRLRASVGTDNLALALVSTDVNVQVQMVDSGGYANITQSSGDLFLQPGGAAAFGAFGSGNTRSYGQHTVDSTLVADTGEFSGALSVDTGTEVGARIAEFLTDNQDGTIRIGQSGQENYGFYWKYMGTGSGNNNSLEFYSENETGADIKIWDVLQDGIMNWYTDQVISGSVSVTGEIADGLVADQGSDTSSTTTALADTSVSVPVEANARYMVDMLLVAGGTNTLAPPAQLMWSVPTGTAFLWHEGLQDAGQTPRTAASKAIIETNGGTDVLHRVAGILTTASTAGNLTARWAQNVASAHAVILREETSISLRRID